MFPRSSPESCIFKIGEARYCGASSVYHRLTVSFWATHCPWKRPLPLHSRSCHCSARLRFISSPLPLLVALCGLLPHPKAKTETARRRCSLGRARFPTGPRGSSRSRLVDPREQQGWVQGKGRWAPGPGTLWSVSHSFWLGV